MLALFTSSSDDWVAPVALAICMSLAVLAFAAIKWLERFNGKQLGVILRRFFGRELRKLDTHEKPYPGYDLGSVFAAVSSIFDDFARANRELGAVGVSSLNDILHADPSHYVLKQKPAKPAYRRLPVDVDVERSFPSNCLYFVEIDRSALLAGTAKVSDDRANSEPPARIAVLIGSNAGRAYYDEELDVRSAPVADLNISIACADKAVADAFFRELEARRRKLCIYRGKVIEPTIDAGGIRTIGFRPLKRVTADDLILPQSVRDLIDRSIVGFYRHRDALRELGVEMKRGVLFHGAPGTGKTSICLHLAGLLPHFTVCFVSGKQLLYPRELCRMARYLQPTLIVFEDIDLIAQERDVNGLATVLGELMNQIDGCDPDEQVLFVMNTNSLDRLEQAVRDRPGRVDQIIHIPLPDAAARSQLIRCFARRLKLPDESLDHLAAATDGATPAMLKEVVKRGAVIAVERNGSNNGTPLELSEADLMLAVQQVRAMRDRARHIGSEIDSQVL